MHMSDCAGCVWSSGMSHRGGRSAGATGYRHNYQIPPCRAARGNGENRLLGL